MANIDESGSRLDVRRRVEAESQNWKIEVELLDLESSIEANIEANIELLAEFLLESGIKNLYKWVIVE